MASEGLVMREVYVLGTRSAAMRESAAESTCGDGYDQTGGES